MQDLELYLISLYQRNLSYENTCIGIVNYRAYIRPTERMAL